MAKGIFTVNVAVLDCPLYYETLKKYNNIDHLIADFVKFKVQNPTSPYGNSDYAFRHGKLKGYGHAKLTRDLSIVYTLTGTQPKYLKLFGVFSHADLGTGTPPNLNKQKAVATRLGNQTFKNPN